MYRVINIGDKFLVTTDHGSWVFLDTNQIRMLKNDMIKDNSKLFKILEDVGVIITSENIDNIIKKVRDKYSFLWQGTSLHIIVPTLRCNQKCVYCHASSKPKDARGFDMNKATAKATVDFIFQSPSDHIIIEFQGGEPLLNFEVVKYIINYANKLNKIYRKKLVFSIVSNFSLMDTGKMDYLIKNKIAVCTSLDGSEWLHNKNRPFPNSRGKTSYYYTKKWVKKITEEYEKRGIKNRRANALITITRYSLGHYKENIDEYVSLGLTDIFLRFLNNLGCARKTWAAISYSPEEFIDFWRKSMDYILGLNKNGIMIREWFTWIMLQKIIKNVEPNFFDQRSPCGAAIGQIAYNYNGDIYTCDEARMICEDIFRLGNVKENKYKDVLSSNKVCAIMASSVNDVFICDQCAFKPYCGICPVCNYAEQGSIIGKISETARCKIFKAQFEYIFDKIVNDKEANGIFLKWLDKNYPY